MNITITADAVEFWALIVAILVGVISITISIFTLKQNSKMIEESTRPVLSIYLGTPNQSKNILYIVLKNFGSSQATIKSFSTNYDLSTINIDKDRQPFHKIKGALIAPGQKFIMTLDPEMYRNGTMPEYVKFDIKYSSSEKEYEDSFNVNLHSFIDMSSINYSINLSGTDPTTILKMGLKSINESIQSITEQNL